MAKYIKTNIGVNTELERFSGFYLFKSCDLPFHNFICTNGQEIFENMRRSNLSVIFVQLVSTETFLFKYFLQRFSGYLFKAGKALLQVKEK